MTTIAKVEAIQNSSTVKKSKLKAVDPKSAEPSKPKLLIFGKPGVGKTWTSLEFPKVFYIDSEGGATRDHYTDRLKKSGGMYLGPEQGSMSFDTIIEQIQALATEEHGYKTVVIDSISKLYNAEIAREQERLGDKDGFGASKKTATALTRRLISWIDRIDMNVVLIAHEKPEWKGGEQIGETFDAWEKIAYELDVTLQIIKTGDARKARVRKSRLMGFPDGAMFDWSYDEFAKRYGKDVIEKESKKISLITPQQLESIRDLLEVTKLPDNQLDKWFISAGVTCWEEMDEEKADKIISYIRNLGKHTVVKGV